MLRGLTTPAGYCIGPLQPAPTATTSRWAALSTRRQTSSSAANRSSAVAARGVATRSEAATWPAVEMTAAASLVPPISIASTLGGNDGPALPVAIWLMGNANVYAKPVIRRQWWTGG